MGFLCKLHAWCNPSVNMNLDMDMDLCTRTHTHTHTHTHTCALTQVLFLHQATIVSQASPICTAQTSYKNTELSNVGMFARQRAEERRRARLQYLQQVELRCYSSGRDWEGVSFTHRATKCGQHPHDGASCGAPVRSFLARPAAARRGRDRSRRTWQLRMTHGRSLRPCRRQRQRRSVVERGPCP